MFQSPLPIIPSYDGTLWTKSYLTLSSFESLVSCSLQACHSTSTLLCSTKCFFQLRQLRRIRRSLDDNSIVTLVHAFVATLAATSTTVSVYWLVHRRRQQTSCNASSMQLHESYRTVASTTEVWPSSSARLYTGSTSPTEFGSGYVSKCTSVSTAWLLGIWRSSVNQSPTSMVTGTCDLLAVAS